MGIPEPTLPDSGGGIPQILASLPEKMEAPESILYDISFKRYNESECDLSNGSVEPYALDALKAIKSLGTQLHGPNDGGGVFGVTTEHVFNQNEYTKLFKGIDDPEIDMREVKLVGKKVDWNHRGRGGAKKITERVSLGRIFFYAVSGTIYVVAVRANHYETSKR